VSCWAVVVVGTVDTDDVDTVDDVGTVDTDDVGVGVGTVDTDVVGVGVIGRLAFAKRVYCWNGMCTRCD
jgi:hypothetical protein